MTLYEGNSFQIYEYIDFISKYFDTIIWTQNLAVNINIKEIHKQNHIYVTLY